MAGMHAPAGLKSKLASRLIQAGGGHADELSDMVAGIRPGQDPAGRPTPHAE
jgi:hypothetical protein